MNLAVLLCAGFLNQVGLLNGEALPAFEPYHISGPYAGTEMCPVCEWGMQPMVIVWTQLNKGKKDHNELRKIITWINDEAKRLPAKYKLRAILVDANQSNSDVDSRTDLKDFFESFKPEKVFFMSRVAKKKAILGEFKLSALDQWTTFVNISNNREVIKTWLNPNAESEQSIRLAIRNFAQ